MQNKILIIQPEKNLITELAHLIEESKTPIVSFANSSLTLLFWQVGRKINEHILQNKRAEYGKQIVPTVSAQLESAYGQNFTEKNVRRMMRFAEQFSEMENVLPLSKQLSWSHFVELLPVKKEKQEGEEKPIGLILCAETSREQVELLEMHKDGIIVAEYWTELPPRKELERKLHETMIEAREYLIKRKLNQ